VASNDNIPFISNTTDNPLLDTLTQIRNLTSRISQLFQSSDFTAIKKPASQWKSVITGIHSLIQNFEDNIHKSISKAEEQFIKNMQAIQQGDMAHETFSKSLKSIADYLSSNITRLFDNILKDIMTDVERSTRDQMKYAQQISSQITSLISQIKQEIVHLLRNIEQNIESYISQGEKNIQSALPENIRQQVETMLSRFESLQLLSKPVPTADGQQQILSFPVKFGEEWTDVKIILNKKKNRKKNKNNQKNFSVRMHVAPSNCGAVSINMDYNLKYKLNVNIEFEKNESRVWFNKHREQMISALKENGIPSVTLSLASGLQSIHCRKKSTIPILPDKDRKNRKIDINV
jgi:RNAse (barnase) inhibitor barstar